MRLLNVFEYFVVPVIGYFVRLPVVIVKVKIDLASITSKKLAVTVIARRHAVSLASAASNAVRLPWRVLRLRLGGTTHHASGSTSLMRCVLTRHVAAILAAAAKLSGFMPTSIMRASALLFYRAITANFGFPERARQGIW